MLGALVRLRQGNAFHVKFLRGWIIVRLHPQRWVRGRVVPKTRRRAVGRTYFGQNRPATLFAARAGGQRQTVTSETRPRTVATGKPHHKVSASLCYDIPPFYLPGLTDSRE